MSLFRYALVENEANTTKRRGLRGYYAIRIAGMSGRERGELLTDILLEHVPEYTDAQVDTLVDMAFVQVNKVSVNKPNRLHGGISIRPQTRAYQLNLALTQFSGDFECLHVQAVNKNTYQLGYKHTRLASGGVCLLSKKELRYSSEGQRKCVKVKHTAVFANRHTPTFTNSLKLIQNYQSVAGLLAVCARIAFRVWGITAIIKETLVYDHAERKLSSVSLWCARGSLVRGFLGDLLHIGTQFKFTVLNIRPQMFCLKSMASFSPLALFVRSSPQIGLILQHVLDKHLTHENPDRQSVRVGVGAPRGPKLLFDLVSRALSLETD